MSTDCLYEIFKREKIGNMQDAVATYGVCGILNSFENFLRIEGIINRQKEDDLRSRVKEENKTVTMKNVKEDNTTKDELYEEAVRIILETQRGSVSLLQRRLEIGYSRSTKLIDLMVDDGIIGEYTGKPEREVLVTLNWWESQKQ